MSSRLALIALLTLPLAACEGARLPGFGTQEEPQAQGHQGPPGVSPLEQPIETGAADPRPVATAEALTNSTAAFSARGNEPFWAVDVAGSTALYKTPDNQRGRPVRVNRLTFGEGVEYVGVLNGRPFVLRVRGRECQDSMADEKFPMTAELTVAGRTSRGCARPASAEVATAVAAIRAPAPAAPRPAATQPAAARPAAARPAAQPAAQPAPTPATPATPAPQEPAPTTQTPAAQTPATPTPATPSPATPAAPATPATTGSGIPAPTMTLPATPPVLPPAAPAAEPADAPADGN